LRALLQHSYLNLLLVDLILFDGTSIALSVSKINEKDPQQRLYYFPVQARTERDLLDSLPLHAASADAMESPTMW